MSCEPSVTDCGIENGPPPSSSSTRSPAAASTPVVGSDTRNTVLWASAAFTRPSARSAVRPSATNSASVGASGAVASTTGSGVLSMSGMLPPLAV